MGKKRVLTKEQVLNAIHRHVIEHGVAPTIDELRRALKVASTRTVLRYLRWLEEEGDIERWPGARGLRTRRALKREHQTRATPLVGEAPAGSLVHTEQNIEGWVHLPKEFTRPESAQFFLLRVKGDSMNQASIGGQLIENGDLVLVRQQTDAPNRQVVVALVDGAVTIKRLVQAPGYSILKPDSTNPNHKPIIVTGEFAVQGVVCRVLKKGGELLGSLA
jgi:SOS regulatory protein LexA